MAAVGGSAVATAALPDGRVWEQVSPVQKFGGDAIAMDSFYGSAFAASNGGGGVAYPSVSGFADAPAATSPIYYNSERTAAGWVTHALTPPLPGSTLDSVNTAPFAQAFSANASEVILRQMNYALRPDAVDGLAGSIYLAGTGPLSWLSAPSIASPIQPQTVYGVGASLDFSHIVFQANPNTPTATVKLVSEDASRTAGSGLYEVVGGQLRAVGILPDGSVPVGGAYYASDKTGDGNGISFTTFGNAVSQDGSHIVFHSSDTAGTVPRQLFDRIDGQRTVLVSQSQLPGHVGEMTPNLATFLYASPDGSKVWFSTQAQLTSDAPVSASQKAYEFDVQTQALTYLPELGSSAGTPATGEYAAGVPLASSVDGSRYVFVVPTTSQLWLSDHGQYTEIAAPVDLSKGVFRASADGSRFVFATATNVPGYNSGGFNQVYVYDVDSATLTCASCPPADVTPSGGVDFAKFYGDLAYRSAWTAPRGITANGREVFFSTPDALLPTSDVNNKRDVYEWDDGTLKLLSSGRSNEDSYILDTSSSGDDVFFATREQLADTDTDGSYDVYDARVGGGFPPPPAPAPCDGNCQPPSSPSPFVDIPASSLFIGPGDTLEVGKSPAASFTVGALSAAAKARMARTGKIPVTVRTTAAGKVSVGLSALLAKKWRSAGSVSRTLSKAGRVTITVTLSRTARRYLAKHRAMRVRLDVAYSRAPKAKRTEFVLRVAAKKATAKQARSRTAGGRHA